MKLSLRYAPGRGVSSPAVRRARLRIVTPLAPRSIQMATLSELIARMEGYFAAGDNWAKRNNNPGNLRPRPSQYGPWPGQVGVAGGFAVFATPEAGWNALNIQIQSDANRGLTLEQFISKYAPPSENDTTNYLNWISSGLDASPDQLLSEIVSPPGEALAQAETHQLGPTSSPVQAAKPGQANG